MLLSGEWPTNGMPNLPFCWRLDSDTLNAEWLHRVRCLHSQRHAAPALSKHQPRDFRCPRLLYSSEIMSTRRSRQPLQTARFPRDRRRSAPRSRPAPVAKSDNTLSTIQTTIEEKKGEQNPRLALKMHRLVNFYS
ncbi:hypothetical protein QZM18_01355 [Burkholderia diffusa]|uniref:hypothetical protein n=1 Tax=Burkholderia diffusa TaxID=488732 RepID=UPI002652C391|nr:hypothetical protein [Burkholderia diffusa]MDN7902771.1 hypothetical protein [Burkholderia diffusa]